MLVRKVCMVGDFAVGKTSLVARFVRHSFSDQYLSTVGVKIDTRTLNLPRAGEIKLVVWDIAGTSALSSVERHYLQGAAGLILVADGTRAVTLDTALSLQQQAQALIGPRPSVLLINKADLLEQWELDGHDPAPEQDPVICSARTGTGVEEAFERLAGQLVTA